MDELRWSMANLARESKVDYDSVNKYVHGKVDQPRGDVLSRLAKALGVTELWLRTGVSIEAPKGTRRRGRGELSVDKTSQSGIILELDFRGGAGGGGGMDAYTFTKRDGKFSINSDAFKTSEWVIPHAYMHGQLRVTPGNALIVEIYGDSMYDPSSPAAPGSLFPGDRVIVDTGDLRPSPPGPFAVFDGVGLVIKLVEVLPKTQPVRIRLSSRNPSYEPYEVTEDEARIVGRVRGRISAM